MEPWVWMGQRYEAASARIPGAGVLNAERSPRLAISWSRTTRLARIESNSVVESGNPVPAVHLDWSARAARTASHSRSAITARKFWIRRTREPPMAAMDDSSTDTRAAPSAGGRITRA